MSSQDERPTPENPCLGCGACCAYYSAAFYWSEADDTPGGTVPVHMTQKFGAVQRVMLGTRQAQPHCVALLGTIGASVRCAIYPLRASVCRDFEYSWQNGKPNERCDRARAAKGLPPLPAPADREPGGNVPRAA
jgi:Fe-S-cluster containining protein